MLHKLKPRSPAKRARRQFQEVYLLVPPSSRQLAAEALVEELQELSKVQSRGGSSSKVMRRVFTSS